MSFNNIENPEEIMGHIAHALPKFDMSELHNPTMVTITVNNNDREMDLPRDEQDFTIPREIICRYSDYFRGLFEGGFSAATSLATTITDGSPEVFQVFVYFLYHNEIAAADEDATTWCWEFLLWCYVFGDQYDSKRFRARIFEAIQIKMLMRQPAWYPFPSGKDVNTVLQHLSSSDLLRKFLVAAQLTEYDVWGNDDAEAAHKSDMPAEFVGECLTLSRRLNSRLVCRHCGPHGDSEECSNQVHRGVELKYESFRTLNSSQWCLYHKHDTEIERRVCECRRDTIAWKFEEPKT